MYKLKNMHTGIIEAETSSLPRAIISANASNHTLVKLLAKDSTEEDVMQAELALDMLDTDSDPERTH